MVKPCIFSLCRRIRPGEMKGNWLLEESRLVSKCADSGISSLSSFLRGSTSAHHALNLECKGVW